MESESAMYSNGFWLPAPDCNLPANPICSPARHTRFLRSLSLAEYPSAKSMTHIRSSEKQWLSPGETDRQEQTMFPSTVLCSRVGTTLALILAEIIVAAFPG
ncbi:hypothetical protein CKAH01_07844 [Colletotrichum kahawae]|uniref:Uncharacterized protein n=1 Tax=Colletotrichum kahawae TaxID=34407 RepID=A0AAD9Y3F4_COLKA|nr:hypothetical protein CKAH01_07844 [Colletotrichum kahawae]